MRFSTLLPCLLSSLLSAQTLVYQSETEGVKTKTEWILDQTNPNALQITSLNPKEGDVKLQYSSSYALQNYLEQQSPSSYLEIIKNVNAIVIKSKGEKGERLKSYSLGSTPWIQEFKFGFKSFLQSQEKECSFYVVNPKDLKIHEMIAIKQGQESIDVEGKTYQAQKVLITLKGFLQRKFWRAHVWFDQTTRWLVKYTANQGPGTPYTTTTLISSNQSES